MIMTIHHRVAMGTLLPTRTPSSHHLTIRLTSSDKYRTAVSLENFAIRPFVFLAINLDRLVPAPLVVDKFLISGLT